MTRWRAVIAGGSLAACGLLAGCGSAAPSNPSDPSGPITLYSGQHEQTVDGLVTAFEKQTGITVNVRNDDEDTLANLIAVQGTHSPADVFYTENSPPLEFLRETADLVAALRDGKIAQCAAPQDLYRRPADAELASFIGAANLLEGVLDGGVVKTLFGSLRLESDTAILGAAGRVTVLIRPEQIDIGPNEAGVTGRVTSYGYHGHDAVLHLQSGHDAEAQPIAVRVAGGPHLPVGSPVTLQARGPVFAWRRD
jgi:ABC-type Fe3+/spermidine/putrescine transport system ATPase subunit